MMRLGLRLAARLAAATAFGMVAAATPQRLGAQVVNGSFEADPCTGSGAGYRLGLSGSDMSGWFIPATNGTYPWCLQNANAFAAGPAAAGNQWFVLGQVSAGTSFTIQQTVSGLTPGGTYNLTFAIASELGCCATAQVSLLSGSSTAPGSFAAPTSGSFWTAWGYNTYSFVANASSVTFQFADDITTGGFDLGLDDVSLAAVGTVTPEPATVSLLLLGIAGLAGVRYRRSRNA